MTTGWYWQSLGAIAATLALVVPGVVVRAQSIEADGTQTVVNQTGSDYAITGGTTSGDNSNLFHSFTDFNVLNGETATFFTEPAVLNILGRITSGNPSLINGLLSVSGSDANLFLLNPAGILFGPNAVLNLQGSFTAATANGVTFGAGDFGAIGSNNYDALVGNPTGFIFNSEAPGSIVNGGDLTVNPGETLQLIGGQVINTGTLEAPSGTIIIAAVEGENLVRIAQEGQVLNLEVATLTNDAITPLPIAPLPIAPLPITPLALPDLLTGSGLSNAVGVAINPDGSVSLTGSDVILPLAAGSAIASGTIAAAAGQVDVLGTTVGIIDALVEVSGDLGGGQIRIGGDYTGAGSIPHADITYVDAASNLRADAITQGAGGQIILWSEQTTRSYGTLSARGGALGGDGGLIETSSRGYLDTQGSPDVSAPNGQGGTWLIDPFDITIGTATTSPSFGTPFTAISGPAQLSWLDIQAAFTGPGTTVAVSTGTGGTQDGNITIIDPFSFGPAVDSSNTLQLEAAGDIKVLADVMAPNGLNFDFRADTGNTNNGQVLVDTGVTLSTSDGFIDLDGNSAIAPGVQIDGIVFAGSDVVITGTSSGGNGVTINGSVEASFGLQIDGFSSVADGLHIDGAISSVDIFLSGFSATPGGSGVNLRSGSEIDAFGFLVIEGLNPVGVGVTLDANPLGSSPFIFDVFGTGGLGAPAILANAPLISSGGTDVFIFSESGDIQLGDITTSGFNISIVNEAGDIRLNSIDAGGGGILITTSDFVQVSGIAGAGASLLTDFGAPIVIAHGGAGFIPFTVGDAALNGTAGAIDNGSDRINPTQAFFFDHQQGNIQITSSFNDCFLACGHHDDGPPLPPGFGEEDHFGPEEFGEGEFSQEFSDHLQLPPVPRVSTQTAQRTLQSISADVGTPPALVYAHYAEAGAPATEPETIGLNKSLGAPALSPGENRFDGEHAQNLRSPNDVLELVIITPAGEPQRIATGATREQVQQAVRQLQRELTDRTRRRQTAYLGPAQQLYQWLIAPLEDTLEAEDIGHMSFILDAGLRSLPLAALHDGEQFIIETYSVGLMPSLSLTDTSYTDIRNAQVLAMGAATFTDQAPLPAVPVELATIAEQLWPGQVYLNETFTPETLVEARQANPYPIVHLATHGEFRNGPLGDSYIQFWDQRLGLDQMAQLRLNQPPLELLVLSACRTALGGETAELGFAGLAVKAGVKSALASLWQVSDAGTAGFMVAFYSSLRSAPFKAQALQQAQLAMLRGEVNQNQSQGTLQWSGGVVPLPPEALTGEDLRHPYYWAAFTLVGNPW